MAAPGSDLEIEEINLSPVVTVASIPSAGDGQHMRSDLNTGRDSTSVLSATPLAGATETDAGILSAAPPCHSMSWSEFSAWALTPSVRHGIISDITWCIVEAKPTSTFIILRIPCQTSPHSEDTASYDIKIEPLKQRVAGWHSLDVSITPSISLNERLDTSKLIIGFIDSAREASAHGSPVFPNGLHSCAGFRDVLDTKWRGPPPTLGHIARYVEHIQELGPPYPWSPSHPSRRGFCRLLIHAITLRHYAFAQVVSSWPEYLKPGGAIHDPSTISSVMRLLILQEQWQPRHANSKAIKRTFYVLGIVICVALYLAGIIGTAVQMPHGRFKTLLLTLWAAIGIPFLSICLFAIFLPLMHYLNAPRKFKLSARTSNFINALDNDVTLTLPLGRRGAYIPLQGYEYHFLHDHSEPEDMELPGPRKAILHWNNPEQEFEHLPTIFTGRPVPHPHIDRRNATNLAIADGSNNNAAPRPRPHRGARAPLLPLWRSGLSYRPDGRKRLLWLSKASS
ncbi:hypothetical protein DL93DRAFT_168999 [Clavulina sp. PMI_390]|nr:hypothetical protein DL93DRAFT_168999 [Clavulina sp. PMI_390]